MKKLKLYIYKSIGKFVKNKHEYMCNVYRKDGVKIGENVHIFSDIISSEPYLISIGNNSTISTNVNFVTHDASIGVINGRENGSDMVGPISIGAHCFVGSSATVLYGVTIGDYTVVAANSVVTKSFPDGHVVIGGNPAKIICTIDDFINKNQQYFLRLHGLNFEDRKKAIEEAEKCQKLINR